MITLNTEGTYYELHKTYDFEDVWLRLSQTPAEIKWIRFMTANGDDLVVRQSDIIGLRNHASS